METNIRADARGKHRWSVRRDDGKTAVVSTGAFQTEAEAELDRDQVAEHLAGPITATLRAKLKRADEDRRLALVVSQAAQATARQTREEPRRRTFSGLDLLAVLALGALGGAVAALVVRAVL